MADKPVAPPLTSDPAAVGPAGFGGTTLLLQFHNLGWCGSGVVLWAALFFGGLMQLNAGLQEFRTGNNFGYCVFSTYGAFWMTIAGILFGINYKILNVTTTDLGWTLVVFTLITAIFFIGALRKTWALAFTFFTLLIGFILLDIGNLGGGATWITIGAIDLIVCAFTAWYMMAHVILAQFNLTLPLGGPWIK